MFWNISGMFFWNFLEFFEKFFGILWNKKIVPRTYIPEESRIIQKIPKEFLKITNYKNS
jgi:hypothetical protein